MSVLHYSDSGQGRAVLFLHGFLEASTMWNYLPLEELKLRTICVDLPGHGQSPVCQELPPSLEPFAKMLILLMDELHISEYDVVGHSMGGYVALELKDKDPRVNKVVLLNSNSWTDPDEKKRDRTRVAELVYSARNLFLNEAIPNLFLDPDENRAEACALIDEAAKMTPDGIAYAALAMASRKDYTQSVLQHTDDYVIIQGEGDRIVSRQQADGLFAGKLGAYYVLTDAGHMAHIEATGKVMEILKETFNKKREA